MKDNNVSNDNIIDFPAKSSNETTDTKEKKYRNKKKNNGFAYKSLAIVIALIICIVIFIIFSDSSFETTDAVNDDPISVLSSENYGFAPYKSGFVFAHDGKIACYNTNMDMQWKIEGSKTPPTVKTNDRYVLTYYKNDDCAIITNGSSDVKIKSDGNVAYADVNSNGYATLIVKEEGFKNQIAVYDKDGKSVFKWHNSDKYISSAYLADDNHTLLATEIVLNDDGVSTNLVLCDIRKELKLKEFSLGESAVCDITFVSKNRFIAVCDDRMACFSTSLSKKWEVDYGKKNLYTYDVSNKNEVALIFGEDDSLLTGSEIEYYNARGKKIGSFVSKSKIQSIDVQGNHSLIAYDRKIAVVNSKGKEISSEELNFDIRKCIFMGNKKCALVISGASATLVEL